MNIYHLSHIDLDGYSCQYLTDNILSDNHNLFFKNTNYGQIQEDISDWLKVITKEDLLLITDLNLNKEEAELIETARQEIGFELQLLDHHITGQEVSELYDWYHLDITKSGTMLTYEWLTDLGYYEPKSHITLLAYLTNIYDLWKTYDSDFQTAKVLNGLLSDVQRNFPSQMNDYYREIIFEVLENASITINRDWQQIEEWSFLEDSVKGTMRNFIQNELKRTGFKPFETIKGEFLAEQILKSKDFIEIEYKGFKGYGFFNLGSSNQEISQYIMKKENIDFTINISDKGSISARGNNSVEDIRIDEMMIELFSGGGHKKAGGGTINKDFDGTLNKSQALNSLQRKFQ